MNDRTDPRAPAQAGTFTLTHTPPTTYTVGRHEAMEEIKQILRTTDTLAVDIETFGLGRDARDIKCVQMGTTDRAVVLDPRDPVQKQTIGWALAQASEIVLHRSPFDAPALCANGLIRPDDAYKITDTLVYARMANPSDFGGNGLEACAERYLHLWNGGVGPKGSSLLQAFKLLGLSKADGYRTFDLDRPAYVMGAATDVILTAALLPAVREAAHTQLTEGHPFSKYGLDDMSAYDLVEREQELNRIMLWRTLKGLRVDLEYLDAYRAQNGRETAALATRLEGQGIRPAHGPSLTAWLEERGELPADHPRTKETKVPSSTADHLGRLAHPLAKDFVRHKQLTKVDKDYLAKVVDLSEDDLIYPEVNILGAGATGRMSYSTPPLQQFPEGARGIVLADEGDRMASVDWSQIEPVVAANVAGDQAVLAGYEDGSSDLYVDLGKVTGLGRKTAKTVVLAQMYGEGLAKLAGDLGITVDQAEAIKHKVMRLMPATSRLIAKLRRVGGDHLKVFTVSGRILTVPMGTYDGRRGPMRHKAVNYFVQGSAYDLLAEAVVECRRQGLSEAIYLAMHDELVVSEGAMEDVRRIMETPPERLCFLAGRTPVLRTDAKVLGERWSVA